MIGIIIAMEEECSLQKSNNFDKQIVCGYNFFVSKNNKYILVFCKIGKINAAICSSILLSKFNINSIINIGTCGAISNFKISDILLINESFDHDIDLTIFGYEIGQLPSEDISVKSSDIYNKKIINILEEIGFNFVKKNILCSSGDKFININNFKNISLFNSKKIDCVDMELFAIAMTCKKFNIPFVSLKLVSDLIFSPSNQDDFKNNIKIINDRINTIINQIINKF